MIGSSVASRLKSFDVYRKLPKDLTEPTMSGALGYIDIFIYHSKNIIISKLD